MRTLRLLLVPAVLLIATACADNSSSSSDKADDTKSPAAGATTAPTSEQYDPQPYCDITRQLEKAGEKAFSTLDRDSTNAEYEAAERNFIVDNEDLLDELVSAAPAHLTDEVETFLAAMRQRGGLGDSGVTKREASSAEKNVVAWEKKNC